MAAYRDFVSAIDSYCTKYRRSDLPELKIGGLYDLFPDVLNESEVEPEASWPASYPNAAAQGVYALFAADLELLYVGKASMSNTLGNRLGNYFAYSKDRTCKLLRDYWNKRPQYLVTVAVPEGMAFEAPAVEEYLVCTLRPCNNSLGTYR